jgi:K+-sensing histidine kinase KdpD
VRARGLIRTARIGSVADEIVRAAHKHHADEIVIGTSRRSWLGGLADQDGASARAQRDTGQRLTAGPKR